MDLLMEQISLTMKGVDHLSITRRKFKDFRIEVL